MAYFEKFLTEEEVWKLSSHVIEIIEKDGKKFERVIQRNSEKLDLFAGSIYYMIEDDKLYHSVVDYKPDGGSKFVKYPGGISLTNQNETLVETCIRESGEECGFRPIIEYSELVYWKYSSADHRNCHHWKTFFLHHKKTGSLRSANSSDHGENSPAYWLEIEDVARLIHYSHWEACKRSVERIHRKFKDSSDNKIKMAFYSAFEALEKRQKQMEEYYASKNSDKN